jgi:hypothetical protein
MKLGHLVLNPWMAEEGKHSNYWQKGTERMRLQACKKAGRKLRTSLHIKIQHEKKR